MTERSAEDRILRSIGWLLGQAFIWLFFLSVLLLLTQCAYFAYSGDWPALPASLLFVEHQHMRTEGAVLHPAVLIPNLFHSGPWQTWLGVWRFIEFISVPVLLLIASLVFFCLSVWFQREGE
ncbi:TPA: hypothetical protein L3690_001840 [Pseudomonas aeruginosa]|nr:hypothetical protein [Pseudomonas aeruginosa]